MSDTEGSPRKGGYRVEYASSARAKCKGPKPCSGTAIVKGELRLGSLIDVRGATSYVWRHWGCVTPKIISNIKNSVGDVEDLDGFDELKDEDKDRLRHAFEEGKVADADIPASARKPVDEESEKPKKKRAPAKKAEADTEEGDEEKPKKAPARKPRAKKAPAASSEAEDGVESEEKPKKVRPAKKAAAKKAPAEKKAPVKKRATKKKEESEESGEDFAEAIADVGHDEEEETAEEAPKSKRKRPTTTKPASSSKKPRTTSSRAKKSKVVEPEDDDDE
ncbi:hypothetical protein SCLCIDRAFT_1209678 [Scleroderma citrinum Foug A]|uniref:PARP-type domain-containing protein n=1 Tax=Scleroderma citrinum Foug A TaxID=1036808 RepID=A0A0C3EJ48_9AGAM|nr:hypothetical protein SCLCIDRAFT_1209678 [Scleroderma citrinum Foug A]